MAAATLQMARRSSLARSGSDRGVEPDVRRVQAKAVLGKLKIIAYEVHNRIGQQGPRQYRYRQLPLRGNNRSVGSS